ncbi:MAG: hypothetical protein IPP19_01035 [Verrucomicrobia bacterium]|nr:hypothetical protein [Verrucomicrobiota bacterium]
MKDPSFGGEVVLIFDQYYCGRFWVHNFLLSFLRADRRGISLETAKKQMACYVGSNAHAEVWRWLWEPQMHADEHRSGIKQHWAFGDLIAYCLGEVGVFSAALENPQP